MRQPLSADYQTVDNAPPQQPRPAPPLASVPLQDYITGDLPYQDFQTSNVRGTALPDTAGRLAPGMLGGINRLLYGESATLGSPQPSRGKPSTGRASETPEVVAGLGEARAVSSPPRPHDAATEAVLNRFPLWRAAEPTARRSAILEQSAPTVQIPDQPASPQDTGPGAKLAGERSRSRQVEKVAVAAEADEPGPVASPMKTRSRTLAKAEAAGATATKLADKGDTERLSKKGKAPATSSGPSKKQKTDATPSVQAEAETTKDSRPARKRKPTAKAKAEQENGSEADVPQAAGNKRKLPEASPEPRAGPLKKVNVEGALSVPAGFKSAASGQGHSTEKPAGATLDQPWHCANVGCSTGLTWLPRDGAGSLSRKAVSHFFGRNKKETNLVHPDVWHNYCRKCYQRLSYRAPNKVAWQNDNLRTQIVRLGLWRPEARFSVQLNKGAVKRLGTYDRALDANGGVEAAAEAAAKIEPKVSEKTGNPTPLLNEEGSQIEHLLTFRRRFGGQTRGYLECLEICDWVEGLRPDYMVPLELLISAPGEGETVNNPTRNYAQWMNRER